MNGGVVHSAPLISARNLSTRFDNGGGLFRRRDRNALSNISMSVDPETCFCLLGESGSGKTTLAWTFLGLNPFTGGEIIYNGETVRHPNDPVQRHLRSQSQMVFQDPVASLNPGFTLARSIEEPLRSQGIRKAERQGKVLELSERVGLSHDLLSRLPGEVSGGQSQRACIARALSSRPQLLVLDEPLTALDAVSRQQVVGVLERIRKISGLTFLLITHNLSLARKIGTHVAVMYAGLMVEKATAGHFFSGPQHPYSRALISAVLEPGFWPGERIVLTGEMPPLHRRPDGCVFHPRCPEKLAICTEIRPVFKPVGPGHDVCCHRVMEGGGLKA
jgi:peptide/nickel transport system ATP-binding protein